MGEQLAWAAGRHRRTQGRHAPRLTRRGRRVRVQVLPQVGLTDSAFATGAQLLPDGGAAAAAERDAAFLVGGGSREYRDGRGAGLAALEAEAAGAGGAAGLEARLDAGLGAERGAGEDDLRLLRLQARATHVAGPVLVAGGAQSSQQVPS
jgi:hypothetical protein